MWSLGVGCFGRVGWFFCRSPPKICFSRRCFCESGLAYLYECYGGGSFCTQYATRLVDCSSDCA